VDHFHSKFAKNCRATSKVGSEIDFKSRINFLGLSDLLILACQKNMYHQQLDIYRKLVLGIKSEQNATCQEMLLNEKLQVDEMTVYQFCMF